MLRLEEVLQLKDGEEIRLIGKRHAMTLVPALLGSLILLVGPFFFLFPLFRTGPTGIIVFAVMVGSGLLIAWRSFAIWDGDACLVSTHRIIRVLQTGLFARVVTEAGIEGIRDVSWMKKGLFGNLWNYGTVIINVSSAPQPIVFSAVPDPKRVHALITDMMDLAKVRGSKGISQEHMTKADRLKKMLEGLSEEDLRSLERTLVRDDREQTIDRLFQSSKRAEARHEEETIVPESSDGDGLFGDRPDERDLSVKRITSASLKEIHD